MPRDTVDIGSAPVAAAHRRCLNTIVTRRFLTLAKPKGQHLVRVVSRDEEEIPRKSSSTILNPVVIGALDFD